MRIRVALGPRAGLSAAEIKFIQSGRRGDVPKTFKPLERLVMKYSEALTRTGTTTAALDRQVKKALDTPRKLVELASVVAIANASARLECAL